jgi:xanthine dehydrogenase accessory factor
MMKEVTSDIDRWLAKENPVALATVVQTWGSAPRKVGAKMALTIEGEISGSVSGGCVEGAVFEEGVESVTSGQARLLHYGVADETAWEVGLACGGIIEVFVEPLDTAVYHFVQTLLDEDTAFATATVIGGPADLLGKKLVVQHDEKPFGSITSELDNLAVKTVQKVLADGRSQRQKLTIPGTDTDVDLFIEVSLPKPKLIMVGGVHIAIALTAIAKTVGYETIVIDPRRAFGSETRFPHVDQLIQSWPDKAFENIRLNDNSAVALLTHDPKIDDPALKVVLNSRAFYIGALGSGKTQAKRRERLREMGFDEEAIGRIYGPIGLNINATTPEEIGVAIMAEIIAARRKN